MKTNGPVYLYFDFLSRWLKAASRDLIAAQGSSLALYSQTVLGLEREHAQTDACLRLTRAAQFPTDVYNRWDTRNRLFWKLVKREIKY